MANCAFCDKQLAALQYLFRMTAEPDKCIYCKDETTLYVARQARLR